MRMTIGRIGCAALILACLTGLPDPPLAQAETPSTDAAKREQTARAIQEYISFLVDEGSVAANDESCLRLKFWIGRLGNFVFPGQVDQYARERYGVILQPIGGPDLAKPLADYATVLRADLVRQYHKICGPPEDPYEDDDGDISFGGGVTSVSVPAIPIGTERRGDKEFAITDTDDRLTGGSFNVEATVPLGGVYRGYVNYQFTDADGSSSARVPEGGPLVAITFPVENPETETTGIGPDAFGMTVTTQTDWTMNDVQFGFGAPVQFFDAVRTTLTAGVRYINIDRDDRIDQELIEFPDISQIIRSNLNTDFFGAQFGIDLNNRPFQGSGFVYGASGSISFLGSHTDGTVRAFVDCPHCPHPDDRDVFLRVDSDLGLSSVALDAQAYIGYRFGERTTVQMIVTATHFTDMPVLHLAVSPEDLTHMDDDQLDVYGIMWRIAHDF